MNFDQREWVTDIATGAITGMWGGLVAALFVPDPPYLDLMAGGGITGLVTGMSVLPIKWLLNRRPGATDHAISAPRDPNESHQGSSSGDAVLKTEDPSS
jgi:hypothetical protein